jgi:hypothetical protein
MTLIAVAPTTLTTVAGALALSTTKKAMSESAAPASMPPAAAALGTNDDAKSNSDGEAAGALDGSEQNISYSAERIIGNGSFGVVFEAKVVETDEVVAIKKVLQDKRFKNRELQIMRQLVKDPHTNIVALRHCFYSQVRPTERTQETLNPECVSYLHGLFTSWTSCWYRRQ